MQSSLLRADDDRIRLVAARHPSADDPLLGAAILVPRALSDPGGEHRRYSVVEIDQLRMMRDEITRGHSASEAVDIVRRYATEDQPRAELLDRFLEASMRLDPAKLREVLMSGAESMGVEDDALRAARDARDGQPWKAGVCDTAHEHLASEAVRVWLARQSAMAPAPFRRSRSCSRAARKICTRSG